MSMPRTCAGQTSAKPVNERLIADPRLQPAGSAFVRRTATARYVAATRATAVVLSAWGYVPIAKPVVRTTRTVNTAPFASLAVARGLGWHRGRTYAYLANVLITIRVACRVVSQRILADFVLHAVRIASGGAAAPPTVVAANARRAVRGTNPAPLPGFACLRSQ
jgi:hypothetical protein